MSANAFSPAGVDASIVQLNLASGIIGVAFNSFFFGLTAMQTAYYWRHCWKNDRRYLKCMVMLVTALSAFQMALFTYTVWNFLIPSHAEVRVSPGPLSVRDFPWWIGALFMANVMGIFAVHTFYLNRLWTLSQNRVFVITLGVLMLAVFALGMYISIHVITAPTASVLASISHVDTALYASLAVTDVTMTTALVTLFLHFSNSSMKSERLIKQLIFYTLTTGALTAVSAVVALIMNLKFPNTIISAVFYDVGESLYACSFLSSLNSRQDLRAKLMETSNGFNTGNVTTPYFQRFATTPFGRRFAGQSRLTTTPANATHSHMQPRIEQDTAVHSEPARSIGERPRIRSKPLRCPVTP